MITKSEAEYENLALTLAQNSEHLMSIKQKLALNRKTEPLFNTKLFTRHLENAYIQAYQNYFDGKEPDTIFVHAREI